MSAHLTEEEQIESFKRWWKENGKISMMAVVLATAGYFGYTGYLSMQEKTAQANSAIYDELIKVVAAGGDAKPTEAELTKINKAAEAVIATSNNGLYTDLARFELAKFAVDSNDFAAAEVQLTEVVQQSKTASSVELASLRLARVKAAQGKNDEALVLLNKGSSDAFAASYAEARGDILQALGRLDEAYTAYEAATTALETQQSGGNGGMRANILKFKMDNARVASINPLAVSPTADADKASQAEASE